jgi:hypothetical protein
MKRPLPSAPPVHDSRNQNEERRAIMLMLRAARARLEQIEQELESG